MELLKQVVSGSTVELLLIPLPVFNLSVGSIVCTGVWKPGEFSLPSR